MNPKSSKFEQSSKMAPYLIVGFFILWAFLFRGFILSEKTLVGDAVNYFEHTSFYINNISRGVYPMWEATRDYGVPTEFFMRRMGDFNPFYTVIILLQKLGMSPLNAYQIFLLIYFFVGMIGFYHLARLAFNDWKIGFVAYLGLLFSTLGTVLYCSFTHLIFVPMFWFFYFLLDFSRAPARRNFLGIIFTLMILAATYIPFYFLTVLLIFLLLFIILFWPDLKEIGISSWQFFRNHKIFVLCCLVILGVSFIPGVQFYQESKTGELVLPTRHYAAATESILGVPVQRGEFGGIIPHLVLEEMFFDLQKMKLSLVYTPWLIHIFFFLSLLIALNRRVVLLFLWGFIIFLFSLYDAAIYKFFYDHVFYFKYFRNFQFFFWLAVLPIFVLIAIEHFRLFLTRVWESRLERWLTLGGVVLIHAGFLFFLLKQPKPLVTSYVSVSLSLIFFGGHILGWWKKRLNIGWAILLVAMVVQPVEVFYCLDKNAVKLVNKDWYRYQSGKEKPYLELVLPETVNSSNKKVGSIVEKNIPTTYLGMYWYNYLRENLSRHVLDAYFTSPLLIYDRVAKVDLKGLDLESIGESWLLEKNIAFISDDLDIPEGQKNDHPAEYVQAITPQSQDIRIVAVDVNSLKLKTNFSSGEFLVWTNNFHKNWHVFVNGRESKLFRANISFKGVWLPPGQNEVYFKYGTSGQYVFKFFMIGLYHIVLVWLMFLWGRLRPQEGARTR